MSRVGYSGDMSGSQNSTGVAEPISSVFSGFFSLLTNYIESYSAQVVHGLVFEEGIEYLTASEYGCRHQSVHKPPEEPQSLDHKVLIQLISGLSGRHWWDEVPWKSGTERSSQPVEVVKPPFDSPVEGKCDDFVDYVGFGKEPAGY